MMEFLKKLLIKKLEKKGKKMGLKSYRKKPNEDEIKKIAIKRIRTKLERLKNYGGEI
jgi:hypothetical protein